MLTQIYNDNLEKSKKIKEKLDKLKRLEQDEVIFGDFLDSHDSSRIN